jgi:hypothetical protein
MCVVMARKRRQWPPRSRTAGNGTQGSPRPTRRARRHFGPPWGTSSPGRRSWGALSRPGDELPSLREGRDPDSWREALLASRGPGTATAPSATGVRAEGALVQRLGAAGRRPLRRRRRLFRRRVGSVGREPYLAPRLRGPSGWAISGLGSPGRGSPPSDVGPSFRFSP